MKQIWASVPKYAVVCIAVFLVITFFGLALQAWLSTAIASLGVPSIALLTNPSTIYTLWLGALSVHAAVGAVAPILGYTLLTTNISSASRVAPGGAVIAFEIKWSKYLRNSLCLLVGSIAALLSVPSALGLAAAVLATIYVVLKTLSVFKSGFDLVERPERFDASARKYLVDAIARVVPAAADPQFEAALQSLNQSIESLVPQAPYRYVASATLRLGDPYRATQFLWAATRAVETLNSEAEKLGYRLVSVRASLPIRTSRGRRDYFALEPLEQVASETGDPPDYSRSQPLVESKAVEKLQKVLDEAISYGPSPWIDDLTRLPMLVQRHVATVIYEAIPNQQPHDLAYGLDVLGQLIDSISETHQGQSVFGLDEYDWVYDIPSFVTNQINCAEHSKSLYARELSDFLRGRLVKWLDRPELDQMSEAYIRLLAKLLRSFAATDSDSAEYMALVIREIPALVRSSRMNELIMIQRELILTFVDKVISSDKNKRERRLIVRTIAEVLRYSPGYERSAVVHAETMVGALAVTLFLAEENAAYRDHISEIIDGLFDDRYAELPFIEILGLIPTISEVNERWKWSWWELDQKERGRAHFMSMELWLTRAVVVAMAPEAWRLSYFDDVDIPNEQTLSALMRAITEGNWLELLPESKKQAVIRLRKPLEELLLRRQELVRARVSATPISEEKVAKFISHQMQDITQTFGRHNEWLRQAGVVEVEDRIDASHQAGVIRLVPKEWFVPDEALDIPILFGGTHLGSALVEFEARRIFKELHKLGLGVTEVPALGDGRIWRYVEDLIDSGAKNILIVGVHTSEYDAYDEYAAVRDRAKARGTNIRFESVRNSGNQTQRVLVVDVPSAFHIVRRRPASEEMPVALDVLPLEGGGVVAEVVAITEQMRADWLKDKTGSEVIEMDARYRESVLSRTVWSFEVVVHPRPLCATFVVLQSPTDSSES